MKIYYELDIHNFEPWSGAVYTYNKLEELDKLDELETILEELYPDGMDETQLNDILWFDDEWIFETLGIRTESEIKEEIEELQEKISDVKEEMETMLYDYDDDCIGIADWERKEIWTDNYKDDYNELKEQLAELEEELKELEEELENY